MYDGSDWFWPGDSMTLLSLADPPTLRLGDRGPYVSAWQARLSELGYYRGGIDGIFGPRTETATKVFQHARGLPADGIVGAATRDAAGSVTSAGEVPRARTPVSETELVDTMRSGHIAALGGEASRERLACGWAHIALENAHGFAIWNNNIGNITAFGWPGEYYAIVARERIRRNPDVWRHIEMRFRVHASVVTGAADYWRVLAGRYAPALERFDGGDAYGAALELSRLGYYTAASGPYASTMAALYRAYPG